MNEVKAEKPKQEMSRRKIMGMFLLFFGISFLAAVGGFAIYERMTAESFAEIKQRCVKQYKEDIKKGINYIQYPCSDELIQATYDYQLKVKL